MGNPSSFDSAVDFLSTAFFFSSQHLKHWGLEDGRLFLGPGLLAGANCQFQEWYPSQTHGFFAYTYGIASISRPRKFLG